ncbi:unnamed protein product [Victoria cruziana]
MAEDGGDLIDLAVETSPVPPRKLRRLKRSENPDVSHRAPISKTLDLGNPEEKENTSFRISRLLDDSGSDRFLRAEVDVSGNIVEEVGGIEENGRVSGLPGKGDMGVEDFGDGAFYRGNDEEDRRMEVLGQDVGAGQDDRAEERNEASEDDDESSGDEGEEQHATVSVNDGEYNPDDREEGRMENFANSADLSSKCEGQVEGEFEEDKIITGPTASGLLKAKRRRGSEGEGKMRKKGKNKSGANGESGSIISASNKRKSEKERKVYLQQLHAESQRLLRETCDASFKPVVGVKKPVSSLLEKMRRRKLELKRRNAELFGASDDITGDDKSERDANVDEDNLNDAEIKQDEENADADTSRIRCEADHVVEDESFLSSSAGNACGGTTANVALPEVGVNTFRAALDDTQALPEEEDVSTFRSALDDTQDTLCDTQIGEDREHLNTRVSEEEAGFSPSLLHMNLNVDSVPQDDETPDEDDDKENINPFRCKDDTACHAKGDPVKLFVDDEAEHDSDDDSLHSDEEEDVENEDEELKDLIATGNEEMPIDREKRDILHRKWLHEQDAAATDDLLQRLKCHWNREPSEGHEEEGDYEMNRDSVSEGDSAGASPTEVVQRNKKLKLDLFKIFPDREAAYVSSDEEEAEQSYLSELVLEKSERKTTYLPHVEDENSIEVFGRIKKLNIAPNNKKRPKTTPSFFDSLVVGLNSNTSSKSSFLGRGQSHSLRSTNKVGVSMAKSFIFGRDDSNSRSGIQMADNLNADKKESIPDSVDEQMKVCTSQSKRKTANAGGCNTKKVPDANAGLSLFEILRRSSFSSDKSLSSNNLNCCDMAFDAFKSVRTTAKIEKRTR